MCPVAVHNYDTIAKKKGEGKVNVDIFHEKFYHNHKSNRIDRKLRLVNNVTQPGK